MKAFSAQIADPTFEVNQNQRNRELAVSLKDRYRTFDFGIEANRYLSEAEKSS